MTPPTAPRTLRRGSPLWLRILLAVVSGALVMMVVAGAFLSVRLTAMIEEQLDRESRSNLALLEGPVRSALERDALDELQSFTAGLGESLIRVTVILPSGEVVAESHRPLPLANHANRPEVRAALSTGTGSDTRSSATVGRDYHYVARRIDDPDGRPLGVLRTALPSSAIQDARSELGFWLFIAALLALPVAGAIAWLAARRIARPLEDMTMAATRMASGDFDRLPRGERDDEAGRLAEALHRTGTALASMLDSSEAKRAELNAILTSMAEGVLALDDQKQLLLANDRTAECLGLRDRPAPGTPLAQVCRVPELVDCVDRALEGERTPDRDIRLPGHAGRVMAVSSAPLKGADGTVRGAVVAMRDVTVMRRLEQMRLDFVANVSHELRTPLAATLSAVETITRLGPEEHEAREHMLATAMRHGQRMGAIVEDLLTLSRIESEGDSLERTAVPVTRTIRAAAGAIVDGARKRGITLELPESRAEDDDVLVLGNDGRLEQVWINLLGNAVKYTEEDGRVDVTVAEDDDTGEAVIRISDTGAGIPEAHLARIFERFYRVDKARSRDAGGTGLGLAIVKHIVRSHRGRIDVTSELGQGTTFEVRLPLA